MKARAGGSLLLAGLVAIGLSGCGFLTPQATTFKYDPSDGVGTDLGALDIENAIVLTEDGTTGSLLVSIVNSDTSSDLSLKVQYETASGRSDAKIEAIHGATTTVGYDGGTKLLLEGIDVEPGALLPVYFQYGSHPGEQLLVPVLDGSLPQYADLLPEG